MSDNILKKEFNKKDVERLRNLVKGKAGERTTQGIGYTKKEVGNKEIDNMVKEYTQYMKMKMEESNDGFVTEAGEVEKWKGGIDKERAEEALREGIEYLKSLKK